MNLYEWASFYADAGMRVFPAVEKRPFPGTITHNGKKYTWPEYASTDKADIKFTLDLALKKSKNKMVELAWAIDEKHVVLDIDRAEKFERFLTEKHLQVPETLTQLSAREGGKHYIYTVDRCYRNQAFNDHEEPDRKKSRIFDLKTRGGYIVLATGQTKRRWESWREPVPLPAEWLSLLKPYASTDVSTIDWDAQVLWNSLTRDEQLKLGHDTTVAVNYVAKMDPAISGQGGSSQTFKVALVLLKKFTLPPAFALQVLKNVYNPRCEPPWKEKDLRQKVMRAASVDDWGESEEDKIYNMFLEKVRHESEQKLLDELNGE